MLRRRKILLRTKDRKKMKKAMMMMMVASDPRVRPAQRPHRDVLRRPSSDPGQSDELRDHVAWLVH